MRGSVSLFLALVCGLYAARAVIIGIDLGTLYYKVTSARLLSHADHVGQTREGVDGGGEQRGEEEDAYAGGIGEQAGVPVGRGESVCPKTLQLHALPGAALGP